MKIVARLVWLLIIWKRNWWVSRGISRGNLFKKTSSFKFFFLLYFHSFYTRTHKQWLEQGTVKTWPFNNFVVFFFSLRLLFGRQKYFSPSTPPLLCRESSTCRQFNCYLCATLNSLIYAMSLMFKHQTSNLKSYVSTHFKFHNKKNKTTTTVNRYRNIRNWGESKSIFKSFFCEISNEK